MNFFEQQDVARRNARLLLWAFLAAVLGLVLLTNLAVAAFFWLVEGHSAPGAQQGDLRSFLDYFSWQRFGRIALAICGAVAVVVLFKWLQLSTGGGAVAEGMGGRQVLPQTDDPDERRCLNVVEELALAATMPVPPLYVLDGERGINAFAAGRTPADAVVAVTRGTLSQLRRHELEGVIGHEFSHILNGDMRLNIRLAAMLKGITFISDIGYLLMHAGGSPRSGRSREGNALPLLGLGLWLLGWFGGMASGFIKAAIGRQKEYLADASAVQFTRNPDSIGDALKVIGGYLPGTFVHAARAGEMSHIFFGQIRHGLWETFATHPPLDARIRRLDPQWDGRYIERAERREPGPGAAEAGVGRAEITLAAIAAAAAAAEQPAAADTPRDAQLQDRAHEPLGAQAIVCGLLLSDHPPTRERQEALVQGAGTQGLFEQLKAIQAQLQALPSPRRLPLLELCLPALKSISTPQYRRLKDLLVGLIHADGEVELHEWCLYQVTRHYLDPTFVRVKRSRPRYASLRKVAFHVRTVLSVLAWESSGETARVFRLAADALDFPRLEILPREQCQVDAFGNAVRQLADCYPLLKPRLLKAMALAAGDDGRLNAAEREIIASMAAVMDCPVPLLPEPVIPPAD